MNFLAHIYLSDNQPLRQIGNFMADAVKGKDYEQYQGELKTGILLHRAIDSFTDSHPIFRTSVRRLFDEFRHYSPVIIDLYYDHFLAKHWRDFHDDELENFIEAFYQNLTANQSLLPERTQRMIPYLLEENWLWSYQTPEGLGKILTQMDRRTQNRSNMRLAIPPLLENYQAFEEDFMAFFPEVIKHTKQTIHSLHSN